jgi:hypothetical protein
LWLSADTGSSTRDFITNQAAQTLSGTLASPLATGETVYVSTDNGSTWMAATNATVGQTTWSASGLTLAGSSTIKVKVTDLAGNALASAVSATQPVNTVFGANNPAPTTSVAQ